MFENRLDGPEDADVSEIIMQLPLEKIYTICRQDIHSQHTSAQYLRSTVCSQARSASHALGSRVA